MNEALAPVLALMRQGPPAVATMAISVTAAGAPSMRQAGAWVRDDFFIVTVTRASSRRIQHIRATGRLAYAFVDKTSGHPSRNVFLEGTTAIADDPTSLQDFMDERQRVGGIAPPPEIQLDRVLTITQPSFLRAEGFLEGGALLVVRDFTSLEPEIVSFGL